MRAIAFLGEWKEGDRISGKMEGERWRNARFIAIAFLGEWESDRISGRMGRRAIAFLGEWEGERSHFWENGKAIAS